MDGALVVWCLLIFSVLCLSLCIIIKQNLYKPFVVISFLISLFPIVLVAVDCYQSSSSEACVWGQSLMPLYLGFAILFAAPICFLIYYFGNVLWKKLI